jgi:hypothetical protein
MLELQNCGSILFVSTSGAMGEENQIALRIISGQRRRITVGERKDQLGGKLLAWKR